MNNITVFGTGVVGQTIAEKLANLGKSVTVGTRNVENTLAHKDKDSYGRPPINEWLNKHKSIKIDTYANASKKADLIINATNGANSLAALNLAGANNLFGKILLDVANPLDFSQGAPPTFEICNTDSLAERIQRKYPDTKVVKSLNTMNCFLMVNPRLLPETHNVFVSGNDEYAKKMIIALLNSFGWAENEIIDLGDISTARGTEQLVALWLRLYGKFHDTMFNFKVVK